MYDRGEVVSVSNNIVKVKYSNNECREYTMPNALNKGEIFKINENNKYVLYKTYKNEFKDFLKLRKELKKIDIDING